MWLRHRAGDVFAARDAEGECHGYVRIGLAPADRRGLAGGPIAGPRRPRVLNNALDHHNGVVLIDTPTTTPAPKPSSTPEVQTDDVAVRMFKA